MSSPLWFRRVLAGLCVLVSCIVSMGEEFAEQGFEYSIVGSLPGDQVSVAGAAGPFGGLVVWEDRFTDGDGSGISARRLDGSLSGVFSAFRVNELGAGDQSKPAVAVLSDGGVAVAWQSAQHGDIDVYLRCFSPTYTNYGGDVLVNTHTVNPQDDPAVAALDSGECMVVWASYNQVNDTSMRDIYLRRFSNTGSPLDDPVLVNQKVTLNQRTPDVCTLSDGTVLIVWISETVQLEGSANEVYRIDVMGRRFGADGVAMGNEFKINTALDPCANPSVAASSGSGFSVAWSQKDLANSSNSWNVVARTYAAPGSAGTPPVALNSYLFGDQFAPQLASVGADYFAVWTSLRQDGSHEGVFGRFLLGSGVLSGDELQINSTAVSKQILPELISDGQTRFLSVWSGFNGISAGFDLFAQRFASVSDPLSPPDPPFVWPLSFSEISAAWPELAGFDVAWYEVYVDGAASATATVTNNLWLLTNATPNSSHGFRLAYVLQDGRTSPLSQEATATTYGQFGTITYGAIIPFDWMVANWGSDFSVWPDADADTDGDGASNEQEFLAGTDPNNALSVMRTALSPSPQGFFLTWNTEPGRVYQVQKSGDFKTWSDFGGRRFAHTTTDSINVGAGGQGLFRVVLLRN